MRRRIFLILLVPACAAFQVQAAAGVKRNAELRKNLAGLNGPFDLGGALKPEVRYYIQETRYVRFGFDGKRIGSDTYTVRMRCVPAALSGKGGDEYTVREFSVRSGDGPAVTIPGLAGWTYIFKANESGRDGKGQVLGIPHARFENLTTSAGARLPAVASYPVYNSFVDFHMFQDVFSRPAAKRGAIQDLRKIGRKIVHYSAFSEPAVDLGSGIKQGSFFRNGEVTLAFKGIGLVDDAACAIVGFDSGESTLRMIMPVSADKDMEMVGGSQYLGDFFIDLETRWLRKATLDEFVIHETRLPAMGGEAEGRKIPDYTVRHLLVRMVSREEFGK
jgi:hypothetical protein